MHGRYKTWKAGQPDNWQNNEDYAYTNKNGLKWNDVGNYNGNALCYKGLFGKPVGRYSELNSIVFNKYCSINFQDSLRRLQQQPLLLLLQQQLQLNVCSV